MKKVILGLVMATLSGAAFAADTDVKPEGYDASVHEFSCKFDEQNYAGWTTTKDGNSIVHKFVKDGKTVCEQKGFEAGGCNTDRFKVGANNYKKGELMVKNDQANKHAICHKLDLD